MNPNRRIVVRDGNLKYLFSMLSLNGTNIPLPLDTRKYFIIFIPKYFTKTIKHI